MSEPKQILTVFHKHRRGGASKRLYMLIESLLSRGYCVHYVAAELLPLPENERLVAHLISLPLKARQGFWFWFWFSLLAPCYLLQLSLQTKFSAIAVFDPYYSMLAKLASLITRTPILMFIRAVPWRLRSMLTKSATLLFLGDLGDRIGLISAKRIVVVTTSMQEELAARVPLIRSRLVTIPSSVIFPPGLKPDEDGGISKSEYDKWLKEYSNRKRQLIERFDLPDRAFIISTTGELTVRKNIEHLVRALGATESEKIFLIICGEGKERMRMLSVTVGLGLREQVIFTGWLENTFDIVAGCDLFVMPSRHEGMSNSMLEAFGAGVPVLAGNTPEMREVLHYDEMLFDPTHVGDLSNRLLELASNKGKLEELRNLSRKRAAVFTFNWGKRVAELIESL